MWVMSLFLWMFLSFIGFIVLALEVVAWWHIFKKADEPGWKALIPFYSAYIQFKIAWKPLYFWIIMGLGVLGGILSGASAVSALKSAARRGRGGTSFARAMSGGSWFAFSLGLIFHIAMIVFMILFLVKLAKAFGHPGGFAVGLILLNLIFILILAFDKSKYVGPMGAVAQVKNVDSPVADIPNVGDTSTKQDEPTNDKK